MLTYEECIARAGIATKPSEVNSWLSAAKKVKDLDTIDYDTTEVVEVVKSSLSKTRISICKIGAIPAFLLYFIPLLVIWMIAINNSGWMYLVAVGWSLLLPTMWMMMINLLNITEEEEDEQTNSSE